jgi:hypothetical protein
MCSRPLKRFALPQPLAHGIMQFPVTGALLYLQDFLSFLVLFCFAFKGPNR